MSFLSVKGIRLYGMIRNRTLGERPKEYPVISLVSMINLMLFAKATGRLLLVGKLLRNLGETVVHLLKVIDDVRVEVGKVIVKSGTTPV